MADEDIQGDQQADSTSEETAEDEQQQQQSTDDQNDSSFDYGKELEREQGRGSRYSPQQRATHSFKGIVKQLEELGIDPRTLIGEKQEGDASGTQRGTEQAPATADIQKMIDDAVQKGREAALEPIMDSKVAPLTRNAAEAKLVKLWAGRVLPQVENLDEAVQIGYIITNRHRFKDTFSELMRGQGAKRARTDGNGQGQRRQQGKPEPSGKEAEFAKKRGLVWDADAGRHVSPRRKAFEQKGSKAK